MEKIVENDDVNILQKPVVVLFIGMAGSGKTTLLHAVQFQMKKLGKKTYIINLDPAVSKLPYKPNIDIRDSVDYKGAMKQLLLI
jgi:adenylylsulfate kinase-like enzyme